MLITSRRRRLVGSALVGATVTGGVAGIAQAQPTTTTTTKTTKVAPNQDLSAPALPVGSYDTILDSGPALWSGVLRNSAGVPTAGTVLVTAQPSHQAMSEGRDRKQIPLGRIDAGADGAFQVRSPWNLAFHELLNPAQAMNIMIVATDEHGDFTVGFQSVSFVPGLGWADAAQAETFAPQGQFLADKLTAAGMDQQQVFGGVVADAQTNANSALPGGVAGDVRNPKPGTECQYISPDDPGRPYHAWLPDAAMVVVLEKAQQTTGWEYGQTFSTATTTSVSTGINLDAGWVSASGSVTMEGSSATTKTVSIDSELDRAKANKYDIRATTPYGHYDCFSFANPNAGHKIMETASKGYWMDSTFAGIEWQIDDNQYIIPVNCNGIPPRSRFDRENGTSETIDTSWSITMSGKIDFIGKASAKASFDTSHADDHGVSQHMSNKTGATKYVCGDSGPPLAPDSDTTWLLTHRYS